MRIITPSIAATFSAVIFAATIAQTPAPSAPLLRETFDETDQGWTGMGPSAKISVTHDAANVKSGGGTLKFDYQVAKGELNAALKMVTEPISAKAKTARFWVKSDYNASLVLMVQEREPGGRYAAAFFAPAGKWQQVEIAFSDMVLSDGKDDPKDPDGKLDVDQIAAYGIVDMSQVFAQGDNPDLQKLLNIKSVAHTLYVDDFVISADAQAAVAANPGTVVVDTYAGPQLSWTVAGQASASIATGKPLEGKSLQATYQVGPSSLMGLVRAVRPGALAGTKKISFSVAAAKATHLVVQVEETDGGKYNSTVEVAGGNAVQSVDLPFTGFTAGDDSKDTNGTLDVPLIKSITIIDMSGVMGGPEQSNTLWVGPIKAQK